MFGFGQYSKEKALVKALTKGYLLKALELVPQINDPDYAGQDGVAALLAVTRLRAYRAAWSVHKTMALCVEIVGDLLKKGADANVCDRLGCSPLMYTAIDGNVGAFNSLVESGADIHLTDQNQMDAAMHAANWGNSGIVKLLLEKGVRTDRIDLEGQTLLMKTVFQNEDEADTFEVVLRLLGNKVDVNKADKAGHTALSLAMESDSPKTVKALIEAGADSGVGNRSGMSVIKWAKESGYQEIVDILTSSEPAKEKPKPTEKRSIDEAAVACLQKICQAYANNDSAAYAKLESQAREIGERLNREGGMGRMRELFEHVQGRPGSRTLEMLWNGIGEWRG